MVLFVRCVSNIFQPNAEKRSNVQTPLCAGMKIRGISTKAVNNPKVRIRPCVVMWIRGPLVAWTAAVLLLAFAFGGVMAGLGECCGSCELGLDSVGHGQTGA